MINSVLQNIPLMNNLISKFFSSYLGINIDLPNISLDNNNNFNLELSNIEAQPSMINNMLLDKSNIKITNANIGKLKLQISLKEFFISISHIKIIIMPIKISEKKIEIQKIENKKNNTENNINNNNNSQKGKNENTKSDKGIIQKLIDYILERLRININNIDIYILNYETNELNLLYANPCLSIHIPNIKYRNGICKDIKNKDNQIPKNPWDNKHLYINNIILKISKIFNNNNSNKNILEIEDYETIMTFNNENGINFYTNYNNGISCEFGDLQIILNPLQFELIKNFLECYLEYFSNNNIEEKTILKEDNLTNEKEINEFCNNELPFNLTINFNLNSFSFILIENYYKNDFPKLNCFKINKIKNHFCYYEDNYFIFIIDNLKGKIKNDISIELTIDNINLSYIEFLKKLNYTKEELIKIKELESKEKKSEYYEPMGSLIMDEDEVYHSFNEENNLNEKWLQYKFEYFENNILNISNIKIEFLKFPKIYIKEINIGFHPAFCFKFLKLAYDNLILINEIFFYNIKLYKNNENQNLNENLIISINNNDKKISNKSFDNEKIENNKNKNKKNNNGFEFEINIEKLFIHIFCFKEEDEFCNTLNRFFPEFYYDCIFLMENKINEKKYKLEYLTGKDDFEVKILNLKINSNSNNENEISIEKANLFFNDYLLIYMESPLEMTIINNEISINFKLNIELYFKLINNIILFSNIWNYTIQIFFIFFERMSYNFNKGKKDIYEMYNGEKYNEKEKKIINQNNDSSLLIKINISKIDIKCKINIEDDLNPNIIINNILFNYSIKDNLQNICFKLSKIYCKEIELNILDIVSDINIKNQIIENNQSINFEPVIIKPEQLLENYITNYIKYQNLLKSKKPKEKTEIKLIVNLNSISLNVIEGILFANDFYNEYALSNSFSSIVITKINEPSINNNNNSLSTKITSFDTTSLENTKVKEEKLTNFEFKFSINEIQLKMKDNNNDKKNKQLIFELNDININENLIFLNNSKLYFQYKVKNNQIVIVNLGKINGFTIELINKSNNKMEINVKIIDLYFGICKDSLLYIQDLCLYFANLSSKIFISEKMTSGSSLMNTSTLSSYSKLNKTEKDISLKTIHLDKKIKNKLDIKENYLNNNIGSKFLNENSTRQSENLIKQPITLSFIKNDKNCNYLNLKINSITFSIYDGKDFENEIDIDILNNNEDIENQKFESKNSNEFEILETSQFKQKSKRDYSKYITLSINDIKFNLLFETSNSYQFIFSINLIEIIDYNKESDFKILYTRADIHNEKLNNPCMILNVDISNSYNEISVGQYCDYNVNCNIKFAPMKLMLHQSTLYFIINFILLNNNENYIKNTFNSYNYHSFKKEIIDLSQITFIENNISDQNISIITNYNQNKNFIYITNFSLEEFCIYITYQALDYSFTFEKLTIPLPSIQNYPFIFKINPYSGFVSIEEFADFLVREFLKQLSTYQLVVDFIKSLSWTRPFVNLFSDFFYIFISPYYSYKKKENIFTGLLFGVKKFLFSVLSENIFLTEKIIRTGTTFVGITKNNKIGKGSFYEKYVISDENKKFYDYFYKN